MLPLMPLSVRSNSSRPVSPWWRSTSHVHRSGAPSTGVESAIIAMTAIKRLFTEHVARASAGHYSTPAATRKYARMMRERFSELIAVPPSSVVAVERCHPLLGQLADDRLDLLHAFAQEQTSL
jgi:hypothetical protein